MKTDDGIAMALVEGGEIRTCLMRDRHIADGDLMRRDRFRNTNLGRVLLSCEPVER